MKIKRFEASTMSDALRMIKKKFGEDAVILSAKTMKKSGGLLGNKRARKVVVTAATDHAATVEPNETHPEVKPQETQSYSSASDGGASTYSRLSFLKNYQPITRTGKQKVKPKIVQFMTDSDLNSRRDKLKKQLSRQGLTSERASELADQVDALLGQQHRSAQAQQNALSQALEAMQIVDAGGRSNSQVPRVVIMVGPTGAGKTSAVVKLAARQIIEYHKRVGMISLDNQGIAANSALERYAEIMGVHLEKAADNHQLSRAVQALESTDMILVDTPGLSLDDHDQLQRLNVSLSEFENSEVHLVLSATSQENVMSRVVSFFKPLSVDRLLFTKLDWAMEIGPVLNLALDWQTPVTYLSDSTKVPEGIHRAAPAEIAALLLPDDGIFGAAGEPSALTVRQKSIIQEDACYVANRNSDIFHHSSCKSVKRINADNMVMFKDPTEAMGRQFKPCRTCCSELIANKASQRQARRYAGNRC